MQVLLKAWEIEHTSFIDVSCKEHVYRLVEPKHPSAQVPHKVQAIVLMVGRVKEGTTGRKWVYHRAWAVLGGTCGKAEEEPLG